MTNGKTIWEKLDNIPNPIYYGLLVIIVAAVLIQPIGLPIQVSSETRKFYEAVDKLPKDALVYVEVAMLPADAGENAPFLIAFAHHLFSRPVRVVFLTFDEDGFYLYMKYVEETVNPQKSYQRVYGRDYAFLGFLASPITTMAAMAKDLYFPRVDHKGTPLTQLDVMKGAKEVRDITMLVAISGAHKTLAENWVQQWVEPYGAPRYLVCATAMTLPTLKPFYGKGKIEVLVSGAVAAGEYEFLIRKPGRGLTSSDAISLAHILIIAFVLLGNIGYLVRRRKGKV
jgi:hypothetical protein